MIEWPGVMYTFGKLLYGYYKDVEEVYDAAKGGYPFQRLPRRNPSPVARVALHQIDGGVSTQVSVVRPNRSAEFSCRQQTRATGLGPT